ncbi:MAG: hypothetical protein IJ820_00725, partial [Lachnospiraceae bacterium]|nr:hypothetical protein [Lachnospiraceae bacterium]
EQARQEYDIRRIKVKELRRECRLLDGIRDAAMEDPEQIQTMGATASGHENLVKEIKEPERQI